MTDENKTLTANQKISASLPHDSQNQNHKPPSFTRPIRADVMSSTALESMLVLNESLVKTADNYITQLESDVESGARKIEERTAGLTSLNVQARKQLAEAEKKEHRKTVLANSDQKRREELQRLNGALAQIETALTHNANARAVINRATILDPGMSPIQAQVAAAGPAAIVDYVQMAISLLRDSNSLESEKQRARCLVASVCAKLDGDRDLAKRVGWNSATIADEAMGSAFKSLRLRLGMQKIAIQRAQHRVLDLERGRKNSVLHLDLAMQEKILQQKYDAAAA